MHCHQNLPMKILFNICNAYMSTLLLSSTCCWHLVLLWAWFWFEICLNEIKTLSWNLPVKSHTSYWSFYNNYKKQKLIKTSMVRYITWGFNEHSFIITHNVRAVENGISQNFVKSRHKEGIIIFTCICL